MSDEAASTQETAPTVEETAPTDVAVDAPMSEAERQKLREEKLRAILAERGDVDVSAVDGRARITCRKFARAKGELGIAFLAETHVKHDGRSVLKTQDEWEAAYEAFLQAPR